MSKSFLQFIEEHDEHEEEKNGLDTDHDNEVGEPKKHKEAVKKAKKEMLEFFETRKAGAIKIAAAASKNGPSQLTAWHFRAKIQPYNDVLSAIRSDKNENYFIQKCTSLVGKLKFKKLKQEKFQELMGELEVWGEAVAKLFN